MNEGAKGHPGVVVIILNWKNWQDTLLCAESVFHNDYPNFRVVIVDNGSPNGSMEYIKAWAEGRLDPVVPSLGRLRHLVFPPVDKPIRYVEYDRCRAEQSDGREATVTDAPLVLIQTGDNLGYAGGNNVALRYALARCPRSYALILNNDIVISRKFLSLAMNSMLDGSAATAAVLGFPVYLLEEPDHLDTGYIRERFGRGPEWVTKLPDDYRPLMEGVMVSGSAMLISPTAPVKFLPEEYFLYNEESDYCKQIYQHGGTIAVQLDNPVYGGENKSVGAGSPLQIYYARRNKLAYCKKYCSTAEYGVILSRMVYSTLKGYLGSTIRGERMAAKAYLLSLLHHLQGKMGKTWAPP
jgi:GT2 family glycosyltransferase